MQAAPQTTQTTTAKPSQAQQPRETAGQQDEAAVNAQEFESANEQQQAEKLAKVIEEIENAPTREDAERIMKENFGEEGMKEAATELGLDPNRPLGQGDPTRAGRSGANNEDFVTCVRDKAFADIKGAFAFNGVLALVGKKITSKQERELLSILPSKESAVMPGLWQGYWPGGVVSAQLLDAGLPGIMQNL